MIKPKISLLAGAMAAALLAGCSQEETPGVSLSPGEYPLELSAEGLQDSAMPEMASAQQSRGTIDNNWNGVSTVAVQDGSLVKQYTVSSTGAGATASLTANDPIFWQKSTETKSLKAWSPYRANFPTTWTVNADQSNDANCQASDLIFGQLNDLAFTDSNNPDKNKIIFYHQTAKVVVNIYYGMGTDATANAVTQLTIGDATHGLALSGDFVAPLSTENYGTWTESSSNIGGVKPYYVATNQYMALMIPQSISEKRIIAITLNGYDSPFYYTAPVNAKWESGTQYTYNVTVTATGLSVSSGTVIKGWGSGTGGEGTVKLP